MPRIPFLRICLIALLGTCASAQAANLVVANNTDSGAGSLRDAVASAHGGDTITFDPAAFPANQQTTIELHSDIVLADTGSAPLTIDGDGRVVLDGRNATRILTANAGTNTVLHGLALNNGLCDGSCHQQPGDIGGSGGCIANAGTLALSQSTLSHCSASYAGGAVFNAETGTLAVIGSDLSDNTATHGGAIASMEPGTFAIQASTFARNASLRGLGGAIWKSGAANGEPSATGSTATIADSTFVENVGGASGGAITIDGGILVLRNNTFVLNSVPAGPGGALFIYSANVQATNNTFAGNAAVEGGVALVWISGGLTFDNNIVFDNVATGSCEYCLGLGGPGILQVAIDPTSGYDTGEVVANRNLYWGNLDDFGHTAGCLYCSTDTRAINADPKFSGGLADNGGPTATLLPGFGSPAIDIVDPASCPSTDQRGTARPQGAACDIGSVEAVPSGHLLRVEVIGSGYGEVSAGQSPSSWGPPIHACGTGVDGVCVAQYPPNAVVTLTATPAPGSHFTGWSGDCSGGAASAQVTIDAARDCTATFAGDLHTVGGTVSGYGGGGLVLQLNGGDDLNINADGTFQFPGTLINGTSYQVTVLTQPTSPTQVCSVSHGAGTISGNSVTDVAVTCATNTYSIGGGISGLAGSGLALTLNDGAPLNVPSNATGFAFPEHLADLSPYEVKIVAQPAAQLCTISQGSGTLAGANVTSVAIACTTSLHFYSVGGTVAGVTAYGLVLRLNGGNDIAVWPGATSFQFPQQLIDHSNYIVTIAQQPSGQNCVLSAPSGMLNGADVGNVLVDCRVHGPVLKLAIDAGSSYARYGGTIDYRIELTNIGDEAASGIVLTSALSAALNAAGAQWQCIAVRGTCTASGSGPLTDGTLTLAPAGGSLTWNLSAPVFADSTADAADIDVEVSGTAAAHASNRHTLVIFRDTFDAQDGGDAQ